MPGVHPVRLTVSDDLRRSWGEYDNMVIVRRPADVSVQATEAELTAITRADYERAEIPMLPPILRNRLKMPLPSARRAGESVENATVLSGT